MHHSSRETFVEKDFQVEQIRVLKSGKRQLADDEKQRDQHIIGRKNPQTAADVESLQIIEQVAGLISFQNTSDEKAGQDKEDLHAQRAERKLIAIMIDKNAGVEMKNKHDCDQSQRIELRFVAELFLVAVGRVFSSH